MKKGKKNNKKFSRLRGARISFMRNLGNDLIRSGKIETTETRAKAIRPRVEHLVSIAKTATVANRRLVASRVGNEKIVKKLFSDYGPKYAERKGGYLRIVKLAQARKRDGVRLARIEFV
jgi:large subunit ribosomal protein L17